MIKYHFAPYIYSEYDMKSTQIESISFNKETVVIHYEPFNIKAIGQRVYDNVNDCTLNEKVILEFRNIYLEFHITCESTRAIIYNISKDNQRNNIIYSDLDGIDISNINMNTIKKYFNLVSKSIFSLEPSENYIDMYNFMIKSLIKSAGTDEINKIYLE